MVERTAWSGDAPGSNHGQRFLFPTISFFRYVRCEAPLEAHVGTVTSRAEISFVLRVFYGLTPSVVCRCCGPKEPPCRLNCLSSAPHLIAIQVRRADESNSGVAFAATRFFFPKAWRPTSRHAHLPFFFPHHGPLLPGVAGRSRAAEASRSCFSTDISFFRRCGGPTSRPASSRGRLPPAGWTC